MCVCVGHSSARARVRASVVLCAFRARCGIAWRGEVGLMRGDPRYTRDVLNHLPCPVSTEQYYPGTAVQYRTVPALPGVWPAVGRWGADHARHVQP